MGRLGEQIQHIALMMSVGMALPKSSNLCQVLLQILIVTESSLFYKLKVEILCSILVPFLDSNYAQQIERTVNLLYQKCCCDTFFFIYCLFCV